MEILDIKKELAGNAYPGRGIVIGKSADGVHAVIAYFIMGRSVNSRNRVFVEQGDGIRTEAFDPAKLSDPSLVIYAAGARFGKQDHCDERRPDGYRVYIPQGGQELQKSVEDPQV